MDKNQWVMTVVVVAFVFVGIFLYLVFSSNRYDAQQAESGEDESALSVDDALKQLASEKDGAGETTMTKSNETVKADQNTQAINEKISREVAPKKTPVTGPGSLGILVAGMFAVIVAIVSHMYMKKKNISI